MLWFKKDYIAHLKTKEPEGRLHCAVAIRAKNVVESMKEALKTCDEKNRINPLNNWAVEDIKRI